MLGFDLFIPYWGIRNLLELQGLVMVNVFTCLKPPHLSAPVLCPIGLTGMPAGCSLWNRHVGAMHTEALRAFSGRRRAGIVTDHLSNWLEGMHLQGSTLFYQKP